MSDHDQFLTKQDIRDHMISIDKQVTDLYWMVKSLITEVRLMRKAKR